MQSLNAIMSSPPPKTPSSSSAIKPPKHEMHPSKSRPSMAAPSSGLRLGFTDIKPTNSKSQSSGLTQSTPSKHALPPSSPFTFRFTRPSAEEKETGLSGDAQRMMAELREEAMKIKADLAAQREQEQEEEQVAMGRKIAKAKGKAGRFSAVHMAEFKKMDSIENHPSAFRANRVTTQMVPTKGVKRTQSKANLDDSEPVSPVKNRILASPSKGRGLGGPGFQRDTPKKVNMSFDDKPVPAAKRLKQRAGDDSATTRPVSRDGSFLPRPATAGKDVGGIPRSQTLASLMTPTKASLARSGSVKALPASGLPKSPAKPNLSTPSGLPKSPTKPDLGTPSPVKLGGLEKSATTNNLQKNTEKQQSETTQVTSPGRLERVKSILRHKSTTSKGKSALPVPATTPKSTSRQFFMEPMPSASVTTPQRGITTKISTPDTRSAVLAHKSPSPFKKSAIPRSRTNGNKVGESVYPTLKSATKGNDHADGEVTYPDLSGFDQAPEPPAKQGPPTVPGTFTFRSDHTISFGSVSPTGFGSSPGQSSVRHVRRSIMPTMAMPGAFPNAGFNKENKAPMQVLPSTAHGLSSKKRNRVSSDEQEEADMEAERRAAKKRREEPVAEGQALMAPRLIQSARRAPSSPKKPSQIIGLGRSGTPGTPSPVKKKPFMSLSRLNMLARPKLRK